MATLTCPTCRTPFQQGDLICLTCGANLARVRGAARADEPARPQGPPQGQQYPPPAQGQQHPPAYQPPPAQGQQSPAQGQQPPPAQGQQPYQPQPPQPIPPHAGPGQPPQQQFPPLQPPGAPPYPPQHQGEPYAPAGGPQGAPQQPMYEPPPPGQPQPYDQPDPYQAPPAQYEPPPAQYEAPPAQYEQQQAPPPYGGHQGFGQPPPYEPTFDHPSPGQPSPFEQQQPYAPGPPGYGPQDMPPRVGPPMPPRPAREETLLPPERGQARNQAMAAESTAAMCPYCEAVLANPAAAQCDNCLRPLSRQQPPPQQPAAQAAPPMLRLQFPNGELQLQLGQHLVLGRDAGQSPVAGTFTQYDNVSRRHTTVWLDQSGTAWCRDERSTNGTFVNGERLPAGVEAPLRDGDSLRLAADVTAAVRLG